MSIIETQAQGSNDMKQQQSSNIEISNATNTRETGNINKVIKNPTSTKTDNKKRKATSQKLGKDSKETNAEIKTRTNEELVEASILRTEIENSIESTMKSYDKIYTDIEHMILKAQSSNFFMNTITLAIIYNMYAAYKRSEKVQAMADLDKMKTIISEDHMRAINSTYAMLSKMQEGKQKFGMKESEVADVKELINLFTQNVYQHMIQDKRFNVISKNPMAKIITAFCTLDQKEMETIISLMLNQKITIGGKNIITESETAKLLNALQFYRESNSESDAIGTILTIEKKLKTTQPKATLPVIQVLTKKKV